MSLTEDPKWFITGKSGILRGREFVLVTTEEITLGRTDENDITIPEKNVSRHHSSLFVENGICILRDAGARTGLS